MKTNTDDDVKINTEATIRENKHRSYNPFRRRGPLKFGLCKPSTRRWQRTPNEYNYFGSPPTIFANYIEDARLAKTRLEEDRLVSKRLASRRLASRRLASRRLASRKLASRRLASRRLASRSLASRRLASRSLAYRYVWHLCCIENGASTSPREAPGETSRTIPEASWTPPGNNLGVLPD